MITSYELSIKIPSKTRKFSSAIDRFWLHVDMKNKLECWNWIGNKLPSGYGSFTIFKKTHLAHRISWIIFNGDTLKDFLVCHKCDNRSCVNPNHLFLGTTQDNVNDAKKKGRTIKGERAGLSKLKEIDVVNIKNLIRDGARPVDIGVLYGVDDSTIHDIKQGRTWKHLL